MATFSVNNSNNRFTLRLTVTESNINIAQNTSALNYRLDIVANTGYHFMQFAIGYDVTLNGVTVASQSRSAGVQYTIAGNGTLNLCTGTLAGIGHNSDGTKIVPVAYSIDMASADYSPGLLSGNGEMTLTQIARLSTLTADNGTLDVAQILTVTRQSSEYTHTISYVCGSASGTICAKSAKTAIIWTPPINLASQNTTSRQVSIVFAITTFYGNVRLGSNTLIISAAIPASAGPSCSFTTSDTTGMVATYGAYVQAKSGLQVTTTASAQYGATIKDYSVAADGKTASGNSVTISPITGSGELTVQVTVTDSRGYTVSAQQTITVLPYSQPAIIGMMAERCLQDGTVNDEGDCCKVTFIGAVAPLNDLNSAGYILQYKKSAASSYTTITLAAYAGQYAPTGTYIFGAEINSIYDVQMYALDDFGNGTARSLSLPLAFVLMDFHNSGRGIAFGKVATVTDRFDCALDLQLGTPLGIPSGGTGADTAAGARTNLELGELATLSVAPIEKGGTGADTAAGARTNLELGELATLSVAPIKNGGTGAETAADARANLGLTAVTLWSGSASSGTLSFANVGAYTAYVVLGAIRNTSAWTCVVVAGNLVSTSTPRFCQLDNDSSYYINFNVYSNKLVINSSTGGSTIKYISGLR